MNRPRLVAKAKLSEFIYPILLRVKVLIWVLLCGLTALLPLGVAADFHLVDENARTLSEISLFLYGKGGFYRQIAKWNKLSRPYKLRIGQRLELREPKLLSSEQGSDLLLKMWRKRFGIDDPVVVAVKAELVRKVEQKQKFEVAAPLIMKDAEFEPTSAEKLFNDGKTFFDEQDYEKALDSFRKCRELEAELLPPWFFEIRILRLLKRPEEEQKTKAAFLAKHPKLAGIAFFKTIGEGKRDAK